MRNAFGANYRAIDGAETAMFELERGIIFFKSSSRTCLLFEQDQQGMLRLRWRFRSVVTGAIASLGHKLVELGPVLGKAEPLQELLKLALFFLESAQRIGAIFVESAIAA